MAVKPFGASNQMRPTQPSFNLELMRTESSELGSVAPSRMNIRTLSVITAAICLELAGCPGGDATDNAHVAFDVSPSGENIVFSSADGDLFLFDTKSKHVCQLTRTATQETDPVFSPSGTHIAYSATDAGKHGSWIYLLRLSNLETEQLTTHHGVNDVMPSYSSDGSKIVFARAHRRRPYSLGGWTWDDWDVYVIDSDGTNIHRVTNEKYYALSSPKFTGDAESIVYSCDANRQSDEVCMAIFKVAVEGVQLPRALTMDARKEKDHVALGIDPDMSRDGTKIVFVSDRKEPFFYDVYVMNEDGTNPTPLNVLSVSRYNQKPRFSRNGNSVFFLAGTEWNANARPLFSLWEVDADGSNHRCVASQEFFGDPMRLRYRRESGQRERKRVKTKADVK